MSTHTSCGLSRRKSRLQWIERDHTSYSAQSPEIELNDLKSSHVPRPLPSLFSVWITWKQRAGKKNKTESSRIIHHMNERKIYVGKEGPKIKYVRTKLKNSY